MNFDIINNPVGLTTIQAEEKQKEFGLNYIETAIVRSAPKIFLSQFENPLILILVVASLISAAVGDKTDTFIILLMVAVNSLLGFFQEYRSEKAVALLRKKVALKSKVWRNGQEETIDAVNLVPDDLVKLSAGDVVPADLEIINAQNFSLNEALITGESFPRQKTSEESVWAGTSVLTGEALGKVLFIGRSTKLGKSVDVLKKSEPPTDFQIETAKFGRLLVKIITFLVIFVFAVNSVIRGNLLESLLFSLALAVGITPELLPVIITVNLASASRSLGKRGVIIKKLSSIEDLGNTDIICTDKTGTLTEGKISLVKYFNLKNEPEESLLLPSLLIPVKSPLEQAVETGHAPSPQNYRLISYTPFDFKSRRTEIFVETQNFASLHFIQGAPDSVIPLCQKNYSIEWVKQQVKYYHQNGLRVLAVSAGEDKKPLNLLGFLVFSDKPRAGIIKTLNQLKNLGVEIKILTGDNEIVTRHLAKTIGLENLKIVVKETLEALEEGEFQKTVLAANIFARVDPELKLKILLSLKNAGRVVSFLGDGANDAPALKAADVGISVNTALPVAKEAADIILMHKGLETLVEAVVSGRKTFANSIKYILSTASANLGNAFSIVIASLYLPFLPLLPGQIILNNFLSDLPALAIASDAVDPEHLKKPRRWNIPEISHFMFFFGAISSFFDILTFAVLLKFFGGNIGLFRTGWFLESLISEIIVIFSIRTAKPFYKSRPSLMLVFFSLAVLAFSLYLTAGTALGRFFNLTALPAGLILLIFLITTAYFFLAEIGKKIYYH